MTKVLLVSIASPPKTDPESLQVARYTKYLALAGCHIEILTSSHPTLYMEPDSAFDTYSKYFSKIHNFSLFEFRHLNALINMLLPSLNQYPDSKWSFRYFNTNKINKPELIYSRSYPISSTLLALKLKKKWKIPWLMHLSDPWAISYEGNSPSTNFRSAPRKWNRNKEMECLTLADKISFTSRKTIVLYQSEYPQLAKKFILTPNVFDEETINTEPLDFSAKLRIVYTGGFGEKRSPVFLLNTIIKFLDGQVDARDHIEFIFTGPMTRANSSIFKKFLSVKQIKHLGLISYADMIAIQQSSHVLVNIDSDISQPKHSVFFPSKLLEYFAARRRVLNIANRHSTSWQIIESKYGDCIEFEDHESMQNALSNYWLKFKEMDKSFFALSESIREYGAKHNSKELLSEIMKLIKR